MKPIFVSLLVFTVFGMTAVNDAHSQAQAGPRADYLMRGMNAYQEGSYEEAEEALIEARKLNPSSALAAYYLGMTEKKMQNYTDAVKHLKDAVTLQPPVIEGFLELADVYYATDRHDEALHALEVVENLRIRPAETAFLKGLVLSKKKNFSDAVASLQAAKSLDPKIAAAADYHTAVIYTRIGKISEAKDLFRSVAINEPDSDVGILAKDQIEAITAAEESGANRRFKTTAGLSFQYNSNVVLLPNGMSVSALEISRQNDSSAVLTLRSEYAFAPNEPIDFKVRYSLYLNSHATLTSFDVQSHTLGVAPSFRFGEKSLVMPASYNYTVVGSEKYLAIAAFSPTFVLAPAENSRFFISLLYQNKEYFGTPILPEEARSADNIGAGLAWAASLAGSGNWSIRYDINHDDAEGANWSYLGNRIAGRLQYDLTGKTKLTGKIDLHNQVFDNVHSVFLEKRKDTIFTAGLEFLFPVWSRINGEVIYSYTKADSTIDLYSYNQYVAGFGIQAAF